MINVVCGIRSTGRICTDLAEMLEQKGHKVKIAYGRESVPPQYQKYAVRIGNDIDCKMHGIATRVFDRHGFASKNSTKKFLAWAEKYNPDVLHLHNLHGYYIDIEMLFDWIKSRPNMKVIWTLHDCWAFTGHCSYFSYAKCNKWKRRCKNCPQKRDYPASYFIDNSENNFIRKRNAFTGVKNMTIVTPSKWLAGLVKQSFLKEYPVKVIHNGIDTDIFKPTSSNFRKKYHLENKKIILGVASTWDRRKGFDDFIKLAEMLDDSYRIVLVGLSAKQMEIIPNNIIGIMRTNNTKELAAIYTAADVFLNLTHEDNYPTVNLEAQACGTPCITYNTGGSVESVSKDSVISQGDIKKIIEFLEMKEISKIVNIEHMAKQYLVYIIGE